MNNARRKLIRGAIETIRNATADMETARDEEREAYDNLPEGIMYSERGDAMETAADALDEVLESLEMAIDRAEDAAE